MIGERCLMILALQDKLLYTDSGSLHLTASNGVGEFYMTIILRRLVKLKIFKTALKH